MNLDRCHLFSAMSVALLSACGRPATEPAAAPRTTAPADPASRPVAAASSASAPLQVPPDWLGRWTGPEGTYLQIVQTEGVYDITVRNLDGVRTFRGLAGSDSLHFERDGVQESIRRTDGAATGMKWLAEKSRCLTVKPGEGYCRE